LSSLPAGGGGAIFGHKFVQKHSQQHIVDRLKSKFYITNGAPIWFQV